MASAAKPAITYLEYDDAGQLKRQSDPTYAAAGVDWTTFTYHTSGDVASSTDPWNIKTEYNYNKLGQQVLRKMSAAESGDDATRSQSWDYWPDGSLSARSDTAAKQLIDVVDNSDLWARSLTGTWTAVSGGTNTVGTGYRYHAAASGSTDTFTWKVTPDLSGAFDVYVSCPVRSDSTTAASYTVNHSSGSSTATVDQKACTSATQWKKLGNYSFTGGTTKTVELKPSASGVVVADAVKLVPTDTPSARTFTYTYDANGSQTEVNDTTPGALVDRFKTNFDGLGRAVEVLELVGISQKRKTAYTYDLNSNVLSTNATRADDPDNLAASRYTEYAWDVRNLVETVKSGTTSASTKTWSYTYDARAMLASMTKPNGNVSRATYHEDGLLRTLEEKTSAGNGSKLVSRHTLRYTPDGDRSEDIEKLDKAGVTGAEFLDQRSKFTYTPARQLAKVDRSGADAGEDETYSYDAAGNITAQTIGTTSSTMTYDRNRLIKTVTGSTTMKHRYDVFGRASTVDVDEQVVQRNSYDGWDRLIRQQRRKTDGAFESEKSTKYDVFDRTSSHSERVTGQASAVNTRFVYLGLADQVAVEEQQDGTIWEQVKAYTHGPGGQKLAVVNTPVDGSTAKTRYYGVNPHGGCGGCKIFCGWSGP